MRRISVLTFVTLDGVMQAPGAPEEDTTGGFKYGGWAAGYWDDDIARLSGQEMAPPFELLLGRRTYEIFAAHWPFIKNDPMGDTLTTAKKYVVSNTMQRPEWANSTVISGDVVRQIQRLKEQDGPRLQVHGSGDLIQTLLTHDLVDVFHLKIFPIVIGNGKRLFCDGTIPTGFKCVESASSSSGIIIATYERAGEIKTGSFAMDPPSEAELARRRRLMDEVLGEGL